MFILLWKEFMWFLHFSLCFSILFNFPFQWQYILKNQQGDLTTCNQFIEKAELHMERTKSRSFFLTNVPANPFSVISFKKLLLTLYSEDCPPIARGLPL